MTLACGGRRIAESPLLRPLGNERRIRSHSRCRKDAAVVQPAGLWPMRIDRTAVGGQLGTPPAAVVPQDLAMGLSRHRHEILGRDVDPGGCLIWLDGDQLAGSAARRTAVTRNISGDIVTKGASESRQPRTELAGIAFERFEAHAGQRRRPATSGAANRSRAEPSARFRKR